MKWKSKDSFLLILMILSNKKMIDIGSHEEYLYLNESSGFYTKV